MLDPVGREEPRADRQEEVNHAEVMKNAVSTPSSENSNGKGDAIRSTASPTSMIACSVTGDLREPGRQLTARGHHEDDDPDHDREGLRRVRAEVEHEQGEEEDDAGDVLHDAVEKR